MLAEENYAAQATIYLMRIGENLKQRSTPKLFGPIPSLDLDSTGDAFLKPSQICHATLLSNVALIVIYTVLHKWLPS